MDILGSVVAAIITVVGIVIYEVILAEFADNVGSAYALLSVVGIILASVMLIVIVVTGFGRST